MPQMHHNAATLAGSSSSSSKDPNRCRPSPGPPCLQLEQTHGPRRHHKPTSKGALQLALHHLVPSCRINPSEFLSVFEAVFQCSALHSTTSSTHAAHGPKLTATSGHNTRLSSPYAHFLLFCACLCVGVCTGSLIWAPTGRCWQRQQQMLRASRRSSKPRQQRAAAAKAMEAQAQAAVTDGHGCSASGAGS